MDNKFDRIPENDEEMDKLLFNLAGILEKESQGVHMLDPKKFDHLTIVYHAMKLMFQDNGNVKVTYTIGKPYPTMGYVTVEGKSLVFTHPEWFKTSCRLASNLDMYPLIDNAVHIDFTFHGITKKIGEVE